ncbi:unnamed protein product [Sphagnum troendelagicum]|uniref:Galactokinase n=1 Tax=Sphagnum troendelagicum TaxID=128251 RepID=A0ABP0UCE1_9BRYO
MALTSSNTLWPSRVLIRKVKEKVVSMVVESSQSEDVRVVVSPYRICPLGAHIDHQGGSVSAMAISQGVLLGFVSSGNLKIRLLSGQFAGEVLFSIDNVPPRKFSDDSKNKNAESYEEGAWGNYARGAVLALQKRGYNLTQGIVGFLEGSKGFEGCGVSSSAAVGVAFLLALEHANGLVISPEENIELDWLIENGYLGLCNGVLDQSAILLSKRNCLTAIHCSSRKHELVYPPWYDRTEEHYKILLAFSGLQHALSSKPGYNLRVAECQEAARILLRSLNCVLYPNYLPALFEVLMQSFEIIVRQGLLHGDLAKRAKHFFTESARVCAGIDAWSSGNLEAFGKLMSQSGLSSIHNYECGCEPLVQLREILVQAPGVFGARFSGAGFRGCCVALVAAAHAEEAAEYVQESYKKAQPDLAKQLNNATAVFICDSADRAHVR